MRRRWASVAGRHRAAHSALIRTPGDWFGDRNSATPPLRLSARAGEGLAREREASGARVRGRIRKRLVLQTPLTRTAAAASASPRTAGRGDVAIGAFSARRKLMDW